MTKMVQRKKQKKIRSPATCELLKDEQVALPKSRCERSSQGQVVETLYYMSEHLQEWKNRRILETVIPMAKEKQMQAEPHTQGKE